MPKATKKTLTKSTPKFNLKPETIQVLFAEKLMDQLEAAIGNPNSELEDFIQAMRNGELVLVSIDAYVETFEDEMLMLSDESASHPALNAMLQALQKFPEDVSIMFGDNGDPYQDLNVPW
jgi:hypothetical protein